MFKTKIYKFSKLDNEQYKEIASVFKNGGIIVYPTETIYGIGCNLLNKDSIERIFSIKKRDKDKNFISLFKNTEMVNKYIEKINSVEKFLIDRFWPGELTLVLKEKNKDSTIACRVSPHKFIKNIFNYIDFPIISTSANISGQDFKGKIKDIIEVFNGKVDVIIDAGNINDTTPSTVVQVVNNKVKILRQGKLKLDIDKMPCNT